MSEFARTVKVEGRCGCRARCMRENAVGQLRWRPAPPETISSIYRCMWCTSNLQSVYERPRETRAEGGSRVGAVDSLLWSQSWSQSLSVSSPRANKMSSTLYVLYRLGLCAYSFSYTGRASRVADRRLEGVPRGFPLDYTPGFSHIIRVLHVQPG